MIHGNYVARSCSCSLSGAGDRGYFAISGAGTLAADDIAGSADGGSQPAANGPGEYAVGYRLVVPGQLASSTFLPESGTE